MSESGLYVVATPIGNLEDISPRALRVLAEVDLIAAEDTRHTRGLLQHHGISTPLQAVHEHNEEQVAPSLVRRLAEGASMALVSDAGTPLLSDPGYRLVRAARQAGVTVYTVPGPSALTAALSIAGLPTDRFVFEGFLPARAPARRKLLEGLVDEIRTLVFFESSHRVLDSLADLAAVLGARREAAVCRELTKRFETVLSGSLEELVATVQADEDQRRGEFVLVVAGRSAQESEPDKERAVRMARCLLDYLPASQAARAAAQISGVSRREIFAALGHDD
jgi:16S rRNA (cytidine1402-2'-O)-methyltransferase